MYALSAHWTNDDGSITSCGSNGFATLYEARKHRSYWHNVPAGTKIRVIPCCDECHTFGEPEDHFCAECGEVLAPFVDDTRNTIIAGAGTTADVAGTTNRRTP